MTTAEQLRAQGWVETVPGHWHKRNMLHTLPPPVGTLPDACRELVPPAPRGDGSGPESAQPAAAHRGQATGSPHAGASVAVGAPSGSGEGKAPTPAPGRAYKRLRQSTKPLLNKLEAEFLERLREDWPTVRAQALRFRLGNGIWYKPDFVCSGHNTPMCAFEVKGPHAFRGGFENLKVAASLYPEVRWVLAWKEDGLWREQEVLP